MKKLLLVLCFAVFLSGCGKKKDAPEPSPSMSAAPSTVSVSASPVPETAAPSPDKAEEKTVKEVLEERNEENAGTDIDRIEPEILAEETPNDGMKRAAFVGAWRAVGTTSENSAFTAMNLVVTEDSYSISMSFSDFDDTVTYEGEYELNDGILKFDESFDGCTAYFFEGDIRTLVLDNGESLVFCEKIPEEELN